MCQGRQDAPGSGDGFTGGGGQEDMDPTPVPPRHTGLRTVVMAFTAI